MPIKYKRIAGELRQQVISGAFGAGGQLPTEMQLSDQFDVSRQTVRQALELLREEGLIGKRQGSGSFVRPGVVPASDRQRSIAVITTYISDYIFPSILREIETVLSRSNCTPSLYATQNQVSIERRVLMTLMGQENLDGILVEGTKTALPSPNIDLYRAFCQRGVPIVFMNGYYAELDGATFVVDDNRGGGYMLTKYLWNKGHRRIAGIFKSDDWQGHERYAGYAEALLELGASIEDRDICWYNTEQKAEWFAADQLLARMPDVLADCTAVVCYNDEVASSIIKQVMRSGRGVPEDMAVVSFDDSRFGELSARRITSLSHDGQNVGRSAAHVMLKLLDGEDAQSVVLPWSLIEKESG